MDHVTVLEEKCIVLLVKLLYGLQIKSLLYPWSLQMEIRFEYGLKCYLYFISLSNCSASYEVVHMKFITKILHFLSILLKLLKAQYMHDCSYVNIPFLKYIIYEATGENWISCFCIIIHPTKLFFFLKLNPKVLFSSVLLTLSLQALCIWLKFSFLLGHHQILSLWSLCMYLNTPITLTLTFSRWGLILRIER